MDRRTFTKSMAALFAAPSVLFKPAESVASVPPVYRTLPSYREEIIGHYGFTNISMTANYNLEPIFGLGEIYADPFKPTKFETAVSFYIDADHKIERTVYLEGTKKEWVALTEKNRAVRSYHDKHEGTTDTIDDSKSRVYYAASEFRFFNPHTHKRVPAKKVEKNAEYTLHIDIGESFDDLTCRVVCTSFKVVDIQDYNEDEVDFQLEERRPHDSTPVPGEGSGRSKV